MYSHFNKKIVSILLILLITFSFFGFFSKAEAVSSGPNSTSTVADDSSVGTVSWSNPARAISSNNSYATAVLNDNVISHYIKATNFGFSIPSGATINGITVEVEKKAQTASRLQDYRVRIIKGGVIGATDKSNTNWWGTSDTYITYGGSSDLWGEAWTASDINNANFGLALSAYKNTTTGGNVTASIDHVRITITYTNNFTLTYTAGSNGSIVGISPQIVSSGASGTLVTAVPDIGYHFTSWSDGILTAARTDINVTADISVTANFEITINPAPTTTSIFPTSKNVGDSDLSLMVNGINFIDSSVINFNGSPRTTVYVSGTELTATILDSDLLSTGSIDVTVFNGTPGGGTSNAQMLSVVNPVPIVSSIFPSSKNVGDTDLALTINGNNFVSDSVINFNGSPRTTVYVSGTELTATILDSDLLSTGSIEVTVSNESPGGGISDIQILSVNNPVPATTFISSSSKTAGDEEFVMTINGTNFVSDSVVNFNGSARVTTYVNATELNAIIPSTDLITAGIFDITVFNGIPGGGTSNAQIFTVVPGPENYLT
jgi:hypothetical protein